jgi:hypothetical protein
MLYSMAFPRRGTPPPMTGTQSLCLEDLLWYVWKKWDVHATTSRLRRSTSQSGRPRPRPRVEEMADESRDRIRLMLLLGAGGRGRVRND